MDKVVDKIAALGVPGLVLLVAMAVTGWSGAVAITAALAALGGPFGMLGGIALLVILSVISKGLAKFGFEALFRSLVARFKDEGMTADDIITKIESYPISGDLKIKIYYYLDNL